MKLIVMLVGLLVLVVPTLGSAQTTAPSEPSPMVGPAAPAEPAMIPPPPPPAQAPTAASAAPQSYAAPPASAPAWNSEVHGSKEPEDLRGVSITISPLHLILPVLEFTVEVRAAEQFGVALIGGVGAVTVKLSDGTKRSFTATELGTSLRYYVIGDFDSGMQLGGELLWVNVFTDSNVDVSGSAAGVAIGPMLGYKYTSSVGFTFDGQLGVQWVTTRAHASSGSESASAYSEQIIPLLNLNLGWSF